MNKRDFSIIFRGEYEHFFTNENITCEQIYELQRNNEMLNTELIILRLLCCYCGINSQVDIKEVVPFLNKRYKAKTHTLGFNYGKEQQLDNTVEVDGKLKIVMSIKGSEKKGDLRKACLINPLIVKYKDIFLKGNEGKFKVGEKIPVPLQDMARIWNVKEMGHNFQSITITYDKEPLRNDNDWYSLFEKEPYNHRYLFLKGNKNYFFEELEAKLPLIKRYKKI
ncbi:hypothetical protein [Bacillus sp. WC2503]|uniref:hypothetical protein n=1 Tax=Bacillus sp. WC2503 TaxID=3461402 RepID=UPI0040446E7F